MTSERRDHFDRDLYLQAARFSDYHDRYRERDRESDSYRYKDGVGHSRRLYGEDSASMKFQHDYYLDYPQNSDGFNVKDYVNDYHGVSDSNITRAGDERDYYPGSQYLDEGRSGLPAGLRYLNGSKPSTLETERMQDRYTDSYTLGRGSVDSLPKSLGGYDIGACQAPSSALQYLSTNTRKDGGFQSVSELHLVKKSIDIHSMDNCDSDKKDGHFRPGDELNLEFVGPIDRETYKYNWEDKLLSLRGYLRGDVDHTMSSSRNRDYARESPGFSYREDLYVPSNGTRLMTGITSETIGYDGGSGERLQNRSPITSPDITSYSSSYFGLLKERHGAHFYPEFGTRDVGCSSRRSGELPYGKNLMDVNDYRRRDTSRTDFMDPLDVIDEFSRTCINDVGLRNHHSSSRGQLPHNYSDMHGSSYARKQDVEASGYGSACLSYDRELYYNYGSIEPQERHSNEMDGDTWTREERSDVLRLKEYDPFLDRIDDRTHKRLAARDLSSVEPSERKLKRKHFVGEKLLKHGVGRKGVRKSCHQGYGGEDVGPVTVSLSNKFKPSKYDHEKMRVSSKMANYPSSSEKFIPNRSNSYHMSGTRDIKKWLGPHPQKLHVTQHTVKKYKPSLEKRFGHAPKRIMLDSHGRKS